MNIKKENAVLFFIATGHKSAKKWKTKRLETKLEEIKGSLDEVDKDSLGEEEQKVFRLIQKAAKKNKDLKIVENEASPETNKSKKAKKEKKPKEKKVGVIATIIECLKKNPCTKEQILDVLESRFPDRHRESMQKTVNVQVPTRLKSDKDLIVKKDDNGLYSL